jgi:hypothetical protein
MEELEWCEGQRCQEDDRHPSQQRCGLEQKKVKCGRVPKRWKTAEVVVCGLHVSVGEIERATDDNDDPGGQRKRLRQQPPGNNRIGRNEYVGDEIHHQVEHVARPARERFCDLEPTRDRSVDPVDDKCDAEAHEHGRPLAPHRVDQGGERERRAAGCEDVHRERAGWGKRRQGIPRQHAGPVANRFDRLSMYPRIPSYDHVPGCHGPDGEDRVARKSCSYRCVKLGETYRNLFAAAAIQGWCSRRTRSR